MRLWRWRPASRIEQGHDRPIVDSGLISDYKDPPVVVAGGVLCQEIFTMASPALVAPKYKHEVVILDNQRPQTIKMEPADSKKDGSDAVIVNFTEQDMQPFLDKKYVPIMPAEQAKRDQAAADEAAKRAKFQAEEDVKNAADAADMKAMNAELLASWRAKQAKKSAS